MKITITDDRVDSIKIVLESPHELRGLYILLQLISRPEFKPIRNAVGKFEEIPGLGVLSKYDIYQNPLKRIYNLMMGIGSNKPTPTKLKAIVRACKEAIRSYNTKLEALFDSDIMNYESEYKLPFTLLAKAANSSDVITRAAFIRDRALPDALKADPDKKNRLYDLYHQHQEVLSGFRAIDSTRSANVTELKMLFNRLSHRIKNDPYMHSDEARIDGIATRWNDVYVSPAKFASYCGIGMAAVLLTLKSVYDEELKGDLEADSAMLHAMISNTWTTVDSVIVLLGAAACGKFKSSSDARSMSSAVETFASEFPEFRELLLQKGFPYSASDEITYTRSEQAVESDPDLERRPLLDV